MIDDNMPKCMSMTGYGSAKGTCAGLAVTVELKSVNNRNLDCSVHMPKNYLFAEETVKNTVQQYVSRGKVDVFITVETLDASESLVHCDIELAKQYYEAIKQISEATGCDGGMPEYRFFPAYRLATYPGVLTVTQADTDRDRFLSELTAVAEEALQSFNFMREREGAKLAADVSNRLVTILQLVESVERESPRTVEAYRERLYAKLREVLEDSAIDEQRILSEAAIFADKIAVDEETVRLRSHVEQMRGMLAQGSPVGKNMDFLIQEFNREANTTGSKCKSGEIAKTVIALKSEIEKIREQIQNIE